MVVTGFTLPVFGVLGAALLYTLVSVSTAVVWVAWTGAAETPWARVATGLLLVAVAWGLLRATRAVSQRVVGARLRSLRRRDAARFGDKAAMLGDAGRAGLSVPDGWVLPRRVALAPGPVGLLSLRAWARRLGPEPSPLIVRSSVLGEDALDGTDAGRFLSVSVAAGASWQTLVEAIVAVAESCAPPAGRASRPFGVLVQRHVPGELAYVSSVDPVSGRSDHGRLERWRPDAGEASAEGGAWPRWAMAEQLSTGRAPAWFQALARLEARHRRPLHLEVGLGPATAGARAWVLQVRERPWPEARTFTALGLLQTSTLRPASASDAGATELSLSPDGTTAPPLPALWRDGQLFVDGRAQLELAWRSPWELWRLAARVARGASLGDTSSRRSELQALAWGRVALGTAAALSAGLRGGAPGAGLTEAMRHTRADGSAETGPTLDSGTPSTAPAPSGWERGLLPWRPWAAALLERRALRVWDGYAQARERWQGHIARDGGPSSGTDEAWVRRDGGTWQAAPPVVIGQASPVAWVTGQVSGVLVNARRSPDPSSWPDGAVVWALEGDPRWADALPRLAAVLVQRGGALTHLALTAQATGTPYAFGVPEPDAEWDGVRVQVQVDGDGVTLGPCSSATRQAPAAPRADRP